MHASQSEESVRFRTGQCVYSIGLKDQSVSTVHCRVILAVVLCLQLSGCGVMHLNAPPQSHVRLMSKGEKAEIKVERHAWFKYWGGEPINPEDVNASTLIKEQGLKEARIQMTNTFVDGIYSIIPGIFGFPRRTLIVEGNRVLHTPDGALVDEARQGSLGQEPLSVGGGK
jgi:hypothetical protein